MSKALQCFYCCVLHSPNVHCQKQQKIHTMGVSDTTTPIFFCTVSGKMTIIKQFMLFLMSVGCDSIAELDWLQKLISYRCTVSLNSICWLMSYFTNKQGWLTVNVNVISKDVTQWVALHGCLVNSSQLRPRQILTQYLSNWLNSSSFCVL